MSPSGQTADTLQAWSSTLSKRAQKAIAVSGVFDFAAEDAAQRLLDVQGCGRRTLREIAEAIELQSKRLGGFEQTIRGYDGRPAITLFVAAKTLGISTAEAKSSAD